MRVLRYLRPVLLVALVSIFVLSTPLESYAANWRFEAERAEFYDGTDEPCGKTQVISTTSSSLPSDFPEPARTILTNAANASQTSPNMLAGIYMNEHGIDDYRTIETNREKLNGGAVSEDNATGPFQILPQYWKSEWGNINDFEDAAKGAAEGWLKNIGKVGPNPELGSVDVVKEGTVAFGFGTYVSGNPNYSPQDSYTRTYIELGLKRFQQIGQPNGNAAPTTTFTPNQNNNIAFKPTTLAVDTGGDKSPGKVVMFGDSMLAAFAANPTTELFKTKGWNDVEIIAKSGRGLTGGPPEFQPDGLKELSNNVEKIKTAKVIVMELGTNAYDRPTFGQNVDAALKIIKDNNPSAAVYWIDFAANSPVPAGRNKAYEGQNKILVDKAKTGGFKVISWFKTVYPDGDPSSIKPDLVDAKDLIENQEVYVHPTSPNGVNAYANMIVENVINGGGTTPSITNSTDCPANSTSGTGQCVDDTRIPKINDAEKLGEALNKFIESSSPDGSPLRNLGGKFVSGAVRAEVNPFWIIAIAQHESSFGTAGIALNGSNNAFGRRASSSQPSVNGWYKYDSWEESLDGGGSKEDHPTYLKKVYIDDGKLTIRDAMMKYAPPVENNTESYINTIKEQIQKMVELAGDSVSCGNGTGGNLKNATVVKSFEGATITPTTIIIHYTAGHSANAESFANAIRSNKNCGPQGCSVQVWISTEGKVYQMVEPLNTYTEHVSSFNKHSIGIEIDGLDEAEITNNATQYQAVLETVKDLMQIFGIKNEMICAEPNSKGIFGHFEANTCMNGAPGRGHTDPGPGYMAKLRADLGTP